MPASDERNDPEKFPDLKALRSRLVAGLVSVDRLAVKEILNQSYTKHHPYQFVEELVVPALEQIGKGWEDGLYSLSQVYMSGWVCEEGGFILSDNHGEIPFQVPEETLLAISEAAHTWGRYPLDWVEQE